MRRAARFADAFAPSESSRWNQEARHADYTAGEHNGDGSQTPMVKKGALDLGVFEKSYGVYYITSPITLCAVDGTWQALCQVVA